MEKAVLESLSEPEQVVGVSKPGKSMTTFAEWSSENALG
jgi:hypothetical protein